MRLCTCLTLALATAAALVSGPAAALGSASGPVAPRAVADDRRPTCAGRDRGAFPIRTRIRGGPATYVAGGGFHTWAVDLTNTTSRTCGGIHPVVVLVDGSRTLERSQPQLEFYADAEGTTARPVTFERTDADELVGVLGGAGFTVPPRGTLTVRVRLSLTSDAAVPNDVVAKAAVVERRGDDSEWVGESNDYRFRITDGEDENEGKESGEPAAESGAGKEGGGRDGGGAAKEDGGVVPGESRPHADELAASGMREALPYVTGLLLLSAGGLLVATVRRRAG
ncbi:cell wall protein [Streptomyces brasiliscabiei]|uniref:Cell wall protein n=1 Tax=Streptomyces brasiliscabiei TaxID=2736302 RepID=A0ABU8GQK0_9ACTN